MYQENDPELIINSKYYLISYNELMSKSELELKTFGTRVSGFKRLDAMIPNDEITTMLSVYRIAELVSEVVPVRIIKYEDNKKIYNDCIEYLECYKRHYEETLNRYFGMLEKYLKIDGLANILYPHVRLEFLDHTDRSVKALFNTQKVYYSVIEEHGVQNTVIETERDGVKYTEIIPTSTKNAVIIENPEKFDYSSYFKRILLGY